MIISSGYHKQVLHRAPVQMGIMVALLPLTIIAIAGCTTPLDPEEPLFLLEIDLPINEKSTAAELIVQTGTQVVVPLTIISVRNKSLEVVLSISRQEEFPEAIAIAVPEGYISVPTGKHVTIDIVYNAGENVAPGRYHTILTASLKEPIGGIAGHSRSIDIIVTDKPQDVNTSLL